MEQKKILKIAGERLQEKRPKLAPSSIITYVANLKNVIRNTETKITTIEDLKTFLENHKEIINSLSHVPAKNRKTRLSTLIVFSEALDVSSSIIKHYRTAMMTDIKDYQDEIDTNQKSDNQTENWMDWNDILKVRSTLEKHHKIDPDNRDLYQRYVLLSLMTYVEPRRNQDYIFLLNHTSDKEDANYIQLSPKTSKKPSYLIYNIYKTAKYYGTQKVEIPPVLKTILYDWIAFTKKLNPDVKHVFMNDDTPFTTQTFSLYMNTLFKSTKKRITLNILRHSYITNYLGSIPQLSKLKEIAKNMGNSVEKQLEYVKK